MAEKKLSDLDYDWYAKMDGWPLETACLLIFGINPHYRPKWPKNHAAYSPYFLCPNNDVVGYDPAPVATLWALLNIAVRSQAIRVKGEYDSGDSVYFFENATIKYTNKVRYVDPCEFLQWAQSKGYQVPPQLVGLSQDKGGAVPVQRTLPSTLREALEKRPENLAPVTKLTPPADGQGQEVVDSAVGRTPLSRREQLVFDIIRQHGPITAREIVTQIDLLSKDGIEINPIEEGTLYKEILGTRCLLRTEYGVQNRKRVGYFIQK